jgi:hypothetical protein
MTETRSKKGQNKIKQIKYTEEKINKEFDYYEKLLTWY